ncbi:hypothetical protein B0H10DRAFT_2036688, partial [Mycena sp. CBHHK59/15]
SGLECVLRANAAVVPDLLIGPAPPNHEDEARLVRDPESHYAASEFSRWQTIGFLRAFRGNPKDFYRIASQVTGTTPAQCIEQYYLLKRNGFNFKRLISDENHSKGTLPLITEERESFLAFTDAWTPEETVQFRQLLAEHGPAIPKIAFLMHNKTTRQVTRYYWKIHLGHP